MSTRGGSVLILALWVLFFLAALAVAVGAHVSAGIRLAGAMRQDAVAYQAARAGVARAALEIACNTNAWDGLAPEAWNSDLDAFAPVDLGGVTYSLYYRVQTPDGVSTQAGVTGVESRLNINRHDGRIFKAFLSRVGGVGETRAESICSAVEIYLKTKAQRLLTSESGSAYAPPKVEADESFESLHELLFVEGIDAGLFARIEPYLTCYGGGRINVNAAPVDLLLACADAYPATAEKIGAAIAARGAGEAFADAAAFGNVAFLTVQSSAFQGVSVGKTLRGEQEARIEFVTDREGKRLFWHEL